MSTAPVLLAAAATLAALAPSAPATTEEGGPVVVVVRVPKPWYAPRAAISAKMRDTVPQYAQLPGLLFKAYSFERDSGDFGGIYYWRSRGEAQQWFGPAWFERVRRERGVEPSVRFVAAPLSIDNQPGGTPAASAAPAVATWVRVPVPAGVTREALLALFRQSVPEHQQAAGLLRKHFTVGDDGTVGGVYLWRDEASARAWFNAAWQARVQQRAGAAATIEWFDTPILTPTQEAANTAPAGAMIVAAP